MYSSSAGRLRRPSRKKSGVEVLGRRNESAEDQEIAEEPDEEADAISTEQSALGKELEYRSPADRADKRHDVTELDLGFPIPVNVIHIPSNDRAEATRPELLQLDIGHWIHPPSTVDDDVPWPKRGALLPRSPHRAQPGADPMPALR